MKRFLSLVFLMFTLCVFLSVASACDDGNHQHEWTSYNVKEVSCTEDGIVEKVCYCGKKQFENIASQGHVRNSNGECTVCGDGATGHQHNFTWDIVLDATCYSKGVKVGTCDCSYQMVKEIAVKDHTRNQTGECIVCGDGKPAHQHAFTWTTVVEPTCTSRGAKTGDCVCGYRLIEFIEEKEHTFNESGKCSVCGDLDINSCQHDFTWETVVEPTCISVGVKVGACDCGFKSLESVEVSDHIRDNKNECIVCGDSPSGHQHRFVWETIVEPTCLEKGAKVGVCHCGVQTVEIVAENGHVRNAKGECIVCEDGKLDHKHVFSWVTVEDATCTEDGTARGFCKCGTQTVEFVSALGHTRNNLGECIVCGDGVVKGEHQHSYTFEAIVEATCLTKGEYKAKCYCGENITTSINGKHSVNENGVCAVCGETFNTYKGDGLTVSKVLDIYERFGYAPAYKDIVVSNIVYNVINNFYVDFESEEYSAKDIYVGRLATKCQIDTVETVAYVSKIIISNYCLSVQTVDGTITDYGIINEYTFSIQKAVKSIIVNQDKLLIVVYNDDTVAVAGKIAKSGTDLYESEMIFRLCGTGNDQYYEIVGINSSLTEIVIPTTHLGVKVASIGQNAFAYNQTIKKVVIHDNVKVIKEGAFHGCANLETVVFGKGLTEIGKNAFCACSNLKNVVIPSTVTKVGGLAFAVINNPVFCEATDKPNDWSENWCGRFTDYYYANSWTKVNGVPTIK